MTWFLPIHIDTLASFIKISWNGQKGNNKAVTKFDEKIYTGNNFQGKEWSKSQVLSDHSIFVNGIEEVYYNSPTL